MFEAVWQVWVELAPWLMLGAIVAGLLHALLPPGFLQRRLRGRPGAINAVLMGVPLPLCSCGVIPTGLGLKKQGASDGATVGFLISTPQTGIDSVFVTSAMLGMPFALFKLVVAAVTGIAGGLWAEAVSPSRSQEPDAPGGSPLEHASNNKWHAAVGHALEVLRSIWRWIVVGVLASAAIQTMLPANGLAALSGYGGLPGMAAALVISLPLYVCATASAPIAAALVGAGMPLGAAMVFLMAGPATNLATIGAVYRTLGGRQLAVYLTTIVLGSVLGGLLFGWLIDPSAAAPGEHVHKVAWWASLSAWALLALFAWFAVDDLRRWFRQQGVSGEGGASVEVGGMTCEGCVAKLEKSLLADPRVDSVVVTLHPGQVVAHGSITAEHLRQLVKEAGFTAL